MASDNIASQMPLSLVPPTYAPIDKASGSGTGTNQASSSVVEDIDTAVSGPPAPPGRPPDDRNRSAQPPSDSPAAASVEGCTTATKPSTNTTHSETNTRSRGASPPASSLTDPPSNDPTTTGVAGAISTTSGPAKRVPRAPAPAPTPQDLPATAAEVTDLASLSRVVTLLSACIVKAVQTGKSVTAPNKRLIVLAAEETRRALAALERCTGTHPTASTAAVQSTPPLTEPSAPSTATCAAPASTPTPSEHTTTGLKHELMACMREEFSRLKTELCTGTRPGPTEAIRSYAQALGSRPSRGPQALPPTRQPPSQRVSKPALIVAATKPTYTRQDVVAAWRRSISFKDCKYAPLQVKPTSGNKLRVEFETSSQRDATLNRLRGSKEVSAELARSFHPMIIVKGVEKETPVEELSGIIRRQNPTLEGLVESDLTFKFKRNNRNSNLYNAVFIAKNDMFKALATIGRVCVDHQRIHVEEFSPFIQCHNCLQFGHVRKNCPSQEVVCAFCTNIGHAEATCPVKKLDGTAARCCNCAKRNSKFDLNTDTKHKATSTSCPVLRAMKSRVDNRIDYGSAN